MSSRQAIAPIVRTAMQVGDRQNQNVAIVDGVDQSVRKPAEAAPANALAQRMPRLGKAHNAIHSGQHFNQERITQAGSLCATSG